MSIAGLNTQTARQTMASGMVPELREASFDDYPQIAHLQADRGIHVRSREEWRHLWEDNPAYLESRGKWRIGWVLEAGGQLVGYVANIPEHYELNGKRLTAGCGHSWVVKPGYSAYSMLLLNEYLAQTTASICISTTANPASYKAHMALGAVPIASQAWDHSSLWIARYTSFVASWLERRRWPMAHAMSYPISAALYARDSIRQNSFRRRNVASGHYEIEFCQQFDERFDAFWSELKAENPRKLLADRSRSALEWHFRYALLENRLWIAIVREKQSFCSYAIFKLKSDVTERVPRITLIDFQYMAGKAGSLYAILEWALENCSSKGIHVIETIGLSPREIGDISRFAPYTVRQATKPLYKLLDQTLADAFKAPDVWSASLYDGDASV